MSLVKKQMVVLLCFLLFVASLIFANRYLKSLQGPLSPPHAEAYARYKKDFGSLMGLPGVQAGENTIKLTVNKSKGLFGLGVIASFQDPGKYLTIPSQYSKPMRVQREGYWVEFTPAFSRPLRNVTAEVLKSTIIYPDILDDVDIVQHVMPYGIKEDIVIKGKDAPTFYQWKIALDPRLTARLEHNYVSIYKKGSRLPDETAFSSARTSFAEVKLFEIAPPFLMDTKGNKYFQAYTALNNSIYTLSIEKKWLEKLNSYPLVLDPTILHNSSANFATGTHNRSWDEGSGANPSLTSAYHELPADINTVGLWHMNEASGNAADSSGNGNTGTPTGTTVVAGRLGNARSFNGSTDKISVPDSNLWYFTGNFTVETWVKYSSINTGGYWLNCPIAQDEGGGSTNKWMLCYNPSTSATHFHFNTASGGSQELASPTSWTPDPNTWYHIAIVRNGTTYTFYRNGNLDGSVTNTGTIPNSTASLTIGFAEGIGMFGAVDEVRISKVARTPEEIKQNAQRFPYSIYTSPVMDLTAASSWTNLTWLAKGVRTGNGETPISTTNLVAQWNFNETSGTTAVSGGSCGATCNGTLTNFASTSSQDQAAGTGWTANNRRWGAGALMFDGSNDVVSITDSNSLDLTTSLTIETWVNFSDFNQTSGSTLVNKQSQGYILAVYSNNIGDSRVRKATLSKHGVDETVSNSQLSTGMWYHIVATHENGTNKIYINGVLDKSESGKADYTAQASNLLLGDNGAGWKFKGVMDSTRIYSRALTASEILSNYQSGNIEFQTRTSADNSTWEAWRPVTGETAIASMDTLTQTTGILGGNQYSSALIPNLVGLWHLNESTAVNSADDSGNGNTLTSTGTSVVTGKSAQYINARSFPGGNTNYLSCTDAACGGTGKTDMGTGDFTAGAWIKTTATGQEFVMGKGMWPDSSWTFAVNSPAANKSGFTIHTFDGNAVMSTASTTSVNDGNWHFVVFTWTYANNTMKAYVDGILETTNNTLINPYNISAFRNDTASNFVLGQRSDLNSCCGFNGTIDEAFISKTALSASQIHQLYFGDPKSITITNDTSTKIEGSGSERVTIGAPQVDGNTVALWHMDETSGTNGYIKDARVGTFSPSTGGGALTNNLVSYWPLNESSGSRLDTANTNNLTDNNTVTSSTGKVGSAAQFTAANSESLSIDDNPSISTGDISFSVSAWINATSTALSGSSKSLVTKFRGQDPNRLTNREFGLVVEPQSSNKIVFYVFNSGGSGQSVYANTYGSISASTWYHVVGTYNASTDTSTVCVNNTCDSATGITGPLDTGATFRIGANENNSSSTAERYFDGLIDEVGFWKRTLSSQEITDLYNSGNGNGYTGGIVNYGTPTGTTVVDGFYGKGRSFNGSSDYIDTGTSLNPGSQASFSLWLRTTTTTNGQRVLAKETSDYDTPFIIYTTGSGNFYFFTSKSAGGNAYAQAAFDTSGINDGKWHNLAATVSTTTVTTYLDGVQKNTAAWTNGIKSSTENLLIGASKYGGSVNRYFTGSIDEVKIDNIARSADEIAEAYRAGRDHRISQSLTSTDLSSKTKLPFYVASDRPGTFMEATIGESAYANYEPDSNTVGLWHLDEQSGSGAYFKDSSSYGYNASIAAGSPNVVQGIIGKARKFNGSSDYLDTGYKIPAGARSYFLWINYNSLTGTNGYSLTGTQQVGAYTYLGIQDGGQGYFYAGNNGGNFNYFFTTNKWYHVGFTMDGTNTTKIYVNGQQVDTKTYSSDATATLNFLIGRVNSGSAHYINGTIDEVMLRRDVLTADQIRQAYEIGRRTHPVTIDFVTRPQATYSSGTSVTINNPYGTTALTNTLSVGDTIIFKENVNGTETIGQAVVSAIANTSTTYGTVTLASAPTFPSGGYSTNAKVFKWQREYFDTSASLSAHRDATTRLTIRVTDGSAGSTVWLDDFRSNTNYINDNTPDSFDTATGIGTYSNTSIPSTLNRYFQYRAINSSWDTAVSPQLTSVSLNYISNTGPGIPTISAPANGATSVSITPVITLSATDAQSDYLRYKIQIATDNAFTQNLQTFDQTVSQTGWSGQNAQTSTAYNSGSTATYTLQANLIYNQLYYIRAYAIDPGGVNTWSTPSTTGTFTTIPLPAPTNCEISATVSTGPAIVTWTDNLSIEDNYYIESSLDGGAWSAPTTLAANTITSSQTVATGTYQFRIRASSAGIYSSYCTTPAIIFPLQSMRFEGVRMEGVRVR